MSNVKGRLPRHYLGDVEGVALDDTLRDVEAEVLDDRLEEA